MGRGTARARTREALVDRTLDQEYVTSAQTAQLLAGVRGHGPVAAGPPGSIIPALPAAPGPANITAPIAMGGSYTVATGQYVRGAELAYLFEGGPGGTMAPFVNNGVIWSTVTSNVSTRILLGRYAQVKDITNNGTMVLQTGPNVSVTTVAFEQTNFINNGSVYVIGEGTSGAIMLNSSGGVALNTGLVAVQSNRTAATAYSFSNGSHVTNTATGAILVEGARANAILMYGDSQADSTGKVAGLTNDGRIEAVALDQNQFSIGIVALHSHGNPVEVLNRGTIKADVVFIGGYSGTTARPGVDRITNEASGLIQGLMFLDRGDDLVVNRGTIRGDIYMEEGDDRVDNSGMIDGIVDLGWGADRFTGSAMTDLVAGNDGEDQIEGNDGDDLLMGGSNNDRLIGGAGNDGLFGEYGNDVLITAGADYASGGDGDDRIEAGDFGFEVVDGGAGFDTLVLPALGRAVDLSAVLAQQALVDVEKIQMGGGQSLFIRSTDISALSGGESSLQIATHATDQVNLIGGWTTGLSQIIGGINYRSFTLNGATVLVAGTGAVSVNSSAGGTGLDVLTGSPSPLPGDSHGLDFTDDVRFVDRYELHQSITVNPEALWFSEDGHAVLTSYALITLTNYGQLISRREASSTTFASVFGVGEGANNFERIINYGTISAHNFSTASMSAFGISTINSAAIENYGTISVSSVTLRAQGVTAAQLINQGQINVSGSNAFVVGVEQTGTIFNNQGEIIATAVGGSNPYGLSVAVGVWFRNGDASYSNSGTIAAANSGSGGATAIWLEINSGFGTFVNTGTLSGEAAIHVRSEPYYGGRGALHLTNDFGAHLAGKVELAGGDDNILNKGTITGAVFLADGGDVFDGRAGIQSGGVHAGLGNDRLTGGAGADRLFGDGGNDILQAGAGNDWLEGGTGADTFVFVAPGDSRPLALRSDGKKHLPDVIADFAPGVDKIDLSAIDAIGGTAANDAFVFIGIGAFTRQAGQVRYQADGANTSVYADLDGDGSADLHIVLRTPVTLAATDFIL